MFVRFRRRPLNVWKDECIEVILVRNSRVGGKVRQECVKYLGSIRVRRFDTKRRLTSFWRKVRSSLAELDLSESLRKSIEEKILERIPMPEEMKTRSESVIPQSGVREKLSLMSKRTKRRQ